MDFLIVVLVSAQYASGNLSPPPEARASGSCVPGRYWLILNMYVCFVCSFASYRVKCVAFIKAD